DLDQAVGLAQESLDGFGRQYVAAWSAGMRAKLGLRDVDDDVATPLVAGLLDQLRQSQVDHTSFYRLLGRAARGDVEPIRGLFVDRAAFDGWLARWRSLTPDAEAMDRVNPVYIPRNHLVEEALAAATAGDLDPLSRLLAAVTLPYDERPGLERYAEPAPEDFGDYRTFCGT
ncbi:MAG: YdiU family protein, partial [Mycobacterium sp.]|nr:YdiU family protein [Mycobacterium sp.]